MRKKDSKCLCVARSVGVESHKTGAVALPSRPSERWSMDLVADSFSDGRRFRTLTVVDDLSRKCPAIEVDISISGARIDGKSNSWCFACNYCVDNSQARLTALADAVSLEIDGDGDGVYEYVDSILWSDLP